MISSEIFFWNTIWISIRKAPRNFSKDFYGIYPDFFFHEIQYLALVVPTEIALKAFPDPIPGFPPEIVPSTFPSISPVVTLADLPRCLQKKNLF